jgi:hypothetical protein
MLILGIALDQIIFPRTKTINVQDDYIESQKVKDNSKRKTRSGLFGWLKRDPEKKKAREEKRRLRKKK